ncbi:centrosome-associated zinc finger protein Cp190 [Culicoides brevitarsis]|uniref:centrosome-associated zinc finger protein Cp190 n=1 Tax=Culicoides brevitarsis TaxID=469753 RepID=UPI00307B6DDF
MNETKSVKVDNWGVFFLQKLQNFFNRTDYCDLTLQFNDNSQLKVHRLVLSACTDYFNLLEQQCEMIDDILIMPDELQADVVLPIVNFMYTGSLEFQYNMFDKLLKTAKDMNMTVLLKLLEAHHLATRNIRKPTNPVVLNKQAPRNISTTSGLSRAISGVRPVPGKGKIVYKHHQTTIAPVVGSKALPEPVQVIAKYSSAMSNVRGPTRFELDDPSLDTFEGQFDAISYESKPLLTAEQIKREEESSTFERLKKDVTIKRPPPSSLTSPPAKKPNLEDVKELTENIRLRKQLASEEMEDDADEYFDDTPFDDDDDEVQPVNKASSGKSYGTATKTSPRTTISIKEDNGNMNHAKIISEVLKKYPHLVKNNKNIKLKIMQKGGESTIVTQKTPPTAKVYPTKITAANQQAAKAIQKISPQVKVEQKPAAAATPTAAPTANKPRRIDAKTMHELIAKGAENTTGPWLCLRCGIDGRPISIPSYKGFRRHLIAVHKERIDPKLCEECGYKSTSKNDLHYHLFQKHDVAPPKEVRFPKCAECGHLAATPAQLQKHTQEEHPKVETPGVKTIQQCCYCEKVFIKESTLMGHIKQYHREEALEDSVLEDDEYIPNNPTTDAKQIKVLSSVSLPSNKSLQFVLDSTTGQQVTQIGGKSSQTLKLEPSSEADALSKVASGIATSLQLVGTADMGLDDQFQQAQFTGDNINLGGETKILTEDGQELQLTQSQRDEIISQLQSGEGNNVIMILNQESYDTQVPTVVSGTDNNLVVFGESTDATFVPSQAVQIQPRTIVKDEPIIVNMQEAEEKSENVAETHESIQKEVDASAPATEKTSTESSASTLETQKPAETEVKDAQIEDELEKLGAATVVTENDLLDKSDEDLLNPKNADAEEKAKQNLISTLQGDWTEESEDESSFHKTEEAEKKADEKPSSPVLEPALFEDLEKKVEEHETETAAKIADAVDDLLQELDGNFVDDVEKEKSTTENDGEKAKEEKSEVAENKELSKLMDDWDDEDL